MARPVFSSTADIALTAFSSRAAVSVSSFALRPLISFSKASFMRAIFSSVRLSRLPVFSSRLERRDIMLSESFCSRASILRSNFSFKDATEVSSADSEPETAPSRRWRAFSTVEPISSLKSETALRAACSATESFS